MMEQIICGLDACRKPFEAAPSLMRVYCSKPCQSKAQIKPRYTKRCNQCGDMFEATSRLIFTCRKCKNRAYMRNFREQQ